jgi:NADH-quinone oxidoreductase subunit G
VTTPLVKKGDRFEETTWSDAFEILAARLGSYKGNEVGAIGGTHNTNEEAFVLGKFMRTVIGSAHVDAQLGDGLDPQFATAVIPRAKITDLDSAATILVWGPDLKESLPVLYLRVRKAVRNGAQLVVVNPVKTGLDSIATHTLPYRAGTGPEMLRKIKAGDGELQDVRATLDAGSVVALVGRTSMTEDPRLAEAVAAFATSLPGATIMPLLTRANVFGAMDMGLAPTLLPGRVSTGSQDGVADLEEAWGPLPEFGGYSTMEMLDAAVAGELRSLILVGADPVRDSVNPALAAQALDTAEFVVAIDTFVTDSSVLADMILPGAMWGEVDGTATNCEGRVQRIRPSLPPAGRSRSLIGILDDLANRLGVPLGASTLSQVSKEISMVAPAYEGITMDYLTFEGDPDGVVVPHGDAEQRLGYVPVGVAVPVVTGEFTMHLERSLYDDGVWVRNAPSISELVKPAFARLHPGDASRRAIAEGDVIVIGETTEIPAKLDDAVSRGTIVVPANLRETSNLAVTGAVTVDVMRGDA